MRIFAVDPGYEQSAWIVLDGDVVETFGLMPNAQVVAICNPSAFVVPPEMFVFESIEHYGMPVGREVFETCVWTGRFLQRVEDKGGQATRISRQKVKLNVCGSPRATDANIRMALMDRWGGQTAAIGKKKTPGPLYGLKSHLWAALALAVTYRDTQTVGVAK